VEGLSLPFLSELGGNSIDEDTELIELFFGVRAVEEIEVRVVEDLPFL